MLQTLRNLWYNYWTNYTRRLVKMSTLSPPASQGWLTGRVPSPLSTHTKTAGPLLMTGWYSSSWKARSLEYGEGGGFPPPFSYATKQSGGDKTHRPPDTAARLRPTKQPVCFTTERAVCDNWNWRFMYFHVYLIYRFTRTFTDHSSVITRCWGFELQNGKSSLKSPQTLATQDFAPASFLSTPDK